MKITLRIKQHPRSKQHLYPSSITTAIGASPGQRRGRCYKRGVVYDVPDDVARELMSRYLHPDSGDPVFVLAADTGPTAAQKAHRARADSLAAQLASAGPAVMDRLERLLGAAMAEPGPAAPVAAPESTDAVPEPDPEPETEPEPEPAPKPPKRKKRSTGPKKTLKSVKK